MLRVLRNVMLLTPLAATLLLIPRKAGACSCANSPPGFLGAPQLNLPSNARGVVFWRGGSPWIVKTGDDRASWGPLPPTGAFSIERMGERRAKVPHQVQPILEAAPWREGQVAYAVVVSAAEALTPGAYQFSGPEGASIEVTIDSTPLELKALQGVEIGPQSESELRMAAGISCSMAAPAAWRALDVVIPAEVRRYSEGLLIHTWVDGKIWRPSESL